MTNESSSTNTPSHQDNRLMLGVALRPMSRKAILGMLLLAGCNAGEVPPSVPAPETDSGYGGTGDTSDTDTQGEEADQCWSHRAPARAVRWQCEGLAEAAIVATLNVEIPDWVDQSGFYQDVIDYGRFDWNSLFGPWNGESYDQPGINACCLPEIGGANEEGLDESGGEPPGEEPIPQAAEACVHDCADQGCRDIPRKLRELAREVPVGVPLDGPSYRDQLRELADWTAVNHADCLDAMISGGTNENIGAYAIGGEWSIPDSELWPAVTAISIEGQCKVFDWYLPERGEPQACTGINDNNGEDPFEGTGSSFGGFDTFAPTSGSMTLDGPVIFGTHATGTAPLLGFADDCPRECSRVDAWITEETLELQRIALVTPSSLTWEQRGMRLTIDGLHAVMEHPRSIPLSADGDVLSFKIPEGELEVLFAGRVHGVPISVAVPNATPITGSVIPLFDGRHELELDPFELEYRDAYGTWMMQVDIGELVVLDHSPRTTFNVQESEGGPRVDASASFDPDGDPLAFEWFLDGAAIGEGPVLVPEPPAGLSTLALRATDLTGRSSWSYRLLSNGD
jgi:hypothetical protein